MIIFKHRVNGNIVKTQRECIARALIHGFEKAMEEQFMELPEPVNCLVTWYDKYSTFDVSIHHNYYNRYIGKLVPEQKLKEEVDLITRAYDLACEEYNTENM